MRIYVSSAGEREVRAQKQGYGTAGESRVIDCAPFRRCSIAFQFVSTLACQCDSWALRQSRFSSKFADSSAQQDCKLGEP